MHGAALAAGILLAYVSFLMYLHLLVPSSRPEQDYTWLCPVRGRWLRYLWGGLSLLFLGAGVVAEACIRFG